MSVDATFDLSGTVAVVTGASRGIGAAIATILAQHCAHVIITSRHSGNCEPVAATIRDAGGLATARACHISDLRQIEDTIGWVGETFGRLDILVLHGGRHVGR